MRPSPSPLAKLEIDEELYNVLSNTINRDDLTSLLTIRAVSLSAQLLRDPRNEYNWGYLRAISDIADYFAITIKEDANA